MDIISIKKIEAIQNVFITVGTTEFDQLIDILDQHADVILIQLQKLGCKFLAIQIGRGKLHPTTIESNADKYGIQVDIFRFKPTITDEMLKADLIITHCGAGSIIEALSMNKLFIVVVNGSLQGNHQTELSDALTSDQYCTSCYPKTLIQELQHIHKNMDSGDLCVKLYPKVDHDLFPKMIDSLFD